MLRLMCLMVLYRLIDWCFARSIDRLMDWLVSRSVVDRSHVCLVVCFVFGLLGRSIDRLFECLFELCI